MHISLFSILMTILWSTLLIALFLMLRKKVSLLHVCSIQAIILLYLFCAVRLAVPIELPWTKVVSGGRFYRWLYWILGYPIGVFPVYEILLFIWLAGAVWNLGKYFLQYRKASSYLNGLPKNLDRDAMNMLQEWDADSRIQIFRCTEVKAPCCMGIWNKRILLPEKAYTEGDLRYILLHEYTHLKHNDILFKVLIRVLCGIYWWNPLLLWMKKDVNQSVEIRCDLSVTGHLEKAERADYLEVMLDAFRESTDTAPLTGSAGLVENHSASLMERFHIVADSKIMQKKWTTVWTCIAMLVVLVFSYSFILQPKYAVPESEIGNGSRIYEVNQEDTYIIKQGDTYILHTEKEDLIIDENAAIQIREEGFLWKEVEE